MTDDFKTTTSPLSLSRISDSAPRCVSPLARKFCWAVAFETAVPKTISNANARVVCFPRLFTGLDVISGNYSKEIDHVWRRVS